MQSIFRIAAMLALLGGTTAALAASDVSARYDGTYVGSAQPAPNMGAGCPAFEVGQVTIEKGFLRASDSARHTTINGFITEDGYVAAHLARTGGQRFPMDGRLVGDTIVAGYIDTAQNCYWVVRLQKQD